MVLVLSASTLLAVSTAVALQCPFYNRTPKGILTLNWTVVCWLSASHWPTFCADFQYGAENTGWLLSQRACNILLGFATLNLIVARLVSEFQGEKRFRSNVERLTFISVVVFGNCTLLLAAKRLWHLLAMCSVAGNVYAFSAIHFRCRIETTRNWDLKRLERIGDESFFVDWTTPANCLGRYGVLCFLTVIARQAIVLLPCLCAIPLLAHAIYVCSALAAWLMLCAPSHLGGMTLVIKATFRFLTGQSLESNLSSRVGNDDTRTAPCDNASEWRREEEKRDG